MDQSLGGMTLVAYDWSHLDIKEESLNHHFIKKMKLFSVASMIVIASASQQCNGSLGSCKMEGSSCQVIQKTLQDKKCNGQWACSCVAGTPCGGSLGDCTMRGSSCQAIKETLKGKKCNGKWACKCDPQS